MWELFLKVRISCQCCNGGDLSDNSAAAPYNTIAFLWTESDPRLKSAYYGFPSGCVFAVVFKDVSPLGDVCTYIKYLQCGRKKSKLK
jgi:hypothetical protein